MDMSEEKKFTYLEELEASEKMDASYDAAHEKFDEKREKAREKRRQAMRAERRRKARKRQILIAYSLRAAIAAVFILAAVFVIRFAVGFSKKAQAKNQEVTVSAAANQAAENTPAAVSSTVSSAVTLSASSEAAGSSGITDWTYTSSDTAPSGDIVATDNAVYTYDQMEKDLYFLEQRYSDKIKIKKFGTTADSRDLLDVVVGPDSATKDVIIQYSMHGREYINSLLGMKQLEEYLKGWDSSEYGGNKYSELVQDVRLHIIPMMNPDGVSISESGVDAIRDASLKSGLMACYQSDVSLGKGDPQINAYWKTWKANARCVDLNRNFDCGWEGTVGTTQPSCSRYKGESPASENEVKALVALKDSINCVCEIAYHSEGQKVYWDYGSTGSVKEADQTLATTVAGLTGYTMESTVSSAQETAGCSDYFVLVCGIPAVTIETGTGDCPLAIDQWATIWSQNTQVLPAIAQMFSS